MAGTKALTRLVKLVILGSSEAAGEADVRPGERGGSRQMLRISREIGGEAGITRRQPGKPALIFILLRSARVLTHGR